MVERYGSSGDHSQKSIEGNAMRKMLALLFIILLALASVTGYLFLHGEIYAGEKLIAEGQEQIVRETANLKDGKARLEAGKLKAAKGKKRYGEAYKNKLLVLADKLFRGGKGFRDAREKIADGDERVARGEEKVSVGEGRLYAGELKLRQGIEKVRQAKRARLACALGAIFFTSLSIVLGFRWSNVTPRSDA